MASLVLGIAGQAIGPSLFGAGFSLLGSTITGAAIGGAIGSGIGGLIDNALFGGQHVKRQGPRLSDVNIQSSTEGAPIPRVYGRMRVAGQLIWATKFKETSTTTTQSTGGKGIGGGSSVTSTDYTYSISFAVGLCEGVVHKLGRVWADGKVLDLSKFTTRFYGGAEDQDADTLIEEIEGSGNTPAYRGLCYIVFEDLPLEQFGNRIPQMQFELVHSLTAENPNTLENLLTGVTLIPGAGEFVYADEIVFSEDDFGNSYGENVFNSDGVTDFVSSIDDLEALAPNMAAISLVVGWFGTDLRAGHCDIKPGVETDDKITTPLDWNVNGVSRAGAHVVSKIDDRPAYGGTPTDASVVEAIKNLKTRGQSVVFYPFIFMDVAAGNTLPNPYSDNASESGQAVYPWRGRITCSPATGYDGSPDVSSAAATQVSSFFGSAAASDFSVSGTSVSWTGGSDWGYRRMVLHYAKLCVAAGGVDAFIIASELRGITRIRSASSTYPSVSALKTLAADVKAIVGSGCKVGYAADWSEYNNHQTGDASGAVQFNLDPLWADSNIDFIGIDNYMPLADWRDGTDHLDYDAENGPTTIYDLDYLQSNIQGGEDYDWYYESEAARTSQTRTTISDGLGKPWVFRQKDLWNWWSHDHYDRVDGTESGTATDWTPKSKPIWFTEIGCPAVNKGANQPNVFYDPKSSESFFPYFSNGERDDLIQRRFLEAFYRFWNDNDNNPASDQYTGRMVNAARIFAWTWDARPYPFFPSRSDIWGDTANYQLGHWLNGRLGSMLLADLVKALCEYAGFTAYDVSNLNGVVVGFAVTSTMSARDAIDPLGVAYFFDGVETGGVIRFVMRGRAVVARLGEDDLALPDGQDGYGYSLNRAQETDLPVASRITFIEQSVDYRQSVVESRRLVGSSDRVAESTLPLVLDQGQAIGIGDRLIQDAWQMREKATFSLAPSKLSYDATDELEITLGGRLRRFRLTEIDDANARSMKGVATDPSIYDAIVGPSRSVKPGDKTSYAGRSTVVFMDIPALSSADFDNAQAPHVASYSNPWPGTVNLYRSISDSNYQLADAIRTASIIGELTYDFYSGPVWRWDNIVELYVTLYSGTLSSKEDLDVLSGANALAVQNADGEWEIVQFANAELQGTGRYKLTRLLRGQRGSEHAMRHPVSGGARVVFLDNTLTQPDLTLTNYNSLMYWRWGPGGRDISDPSYQGAQLQFKGVGLRPFAPVHLAAEFMNDGADLSLSWIRCDRSPDASDFDQAEVALSEQTESYDVEVMDGDDVVRTIAGVTSPVTYSNAQMVSDFGSALGVGDSLKFTVYQLSAKVGRGIGKTATIYF